VVVSLTGFWGIDEEQWRTHYLVNEGALLLKTGRFDDAVETYREAIESDPTDARAHFSLGKPYATHGMLAESKEMMERAVARNGIYEPFAYVTLGAATARAGEYRQAADYFQTALKADSSLGLAAFNLGMCRLSLGETEAAERAFTRAADLCKEDTGVLGSIAAALVGMERYRKGLEIAEYVLRTDPYNREAVLARGIGLEGLGLEEEAINHYRSTLDILPAFPEVRDRLSELEAR
jgi:tetratricopeptide (TPR) repeat protein